jgi:hypothetical protein
MSDLPLLIKSEKANDFVKRLKEKQYLFFDYSCCRFVIAAISLKYIDRG